MEDWSKNIAETIRENLKGEKDRDLRFFRIDEFIRNIERTEKFADSCPDCKRNKSDITEVIDKIEEAVKVPGRSRRQLDRVTSRLSSHMMKAHNFYAPYHFTYLYSFFGMVAGLLLGFFGTLIFPTDDWIALIIGFVAGLMGGQYAGNRKDKNIRRNKQLM